RRRRDASADHLHRGRVQARDVTRALRRRHVRECGEAARALSAKGRDRAGQRRRSRGLRSHPAPHAALRRASRLRLQRVGRLGGARLAGRGHPARQGGGRQREAQRQRRRRPPCPGQARCRDPGRLRGLRRRPARQARRLTRRRCSLRIGRNRSPRGGPMGHRRLAVCVVITVVALLAVIAPAGAAPEGQMTWGVHISLAPTWFDPVETPEPLHVRFRLKYPWPDFMTFYTAASGAGWIVPKKYVEKVGDDGFKRAPIGAGPYKFVSFTPGIELVMEAFEGYWRKPPS